ncbi:MAG: hypothetical protein AAF543_02055 [Pseudomonadota bacterium]
MATKQADGVHPHSRRWLALGLAGMVYVVGISGLWAMVRTFDETAGAPLTPAGSEKVLPPIEESIDIRDAQLLDGPFIPKFKPELSPEAGGDVASVDLQKES